MGVPANVYRTLPPRSGRRRFSMEPSELRRYLDAAEVAGVRRWIEDLTMVIRITTSAFFQSGVGVSCAPQVGPEGIPRTQGWLFGEDPGVDSPAMLAEGRILHALLLVEQCMINQRASPPFPAIRIGTWQANRKLSDWFNEGGPRFKSTAASDLTSAFGRADLLLFFRAHFSYRLHREISFKLLRHEVWEIEV